MGRRTIDEIKVVEVEKRKIPSKHYVYRLHVTWSDGSTNVIYRRYSRFFDFQSKIIEMFPEEAGTQDPAKRIIPLLPGKKFFGRSHIREVAEKRLGPISEYCQALLDLPEKISLCQELIEFFELEPDDLDPPKEDRVKASMKAHKISEPKPLEHYIAIADYKKQEKGEVTLKVDMLVEVIEKTESGWWFVNAEDEQGWVPSTCLVREDGVKENMITTFKSGEEEQYLCTEEFKPESHDEVAMERGAVVDVLEKNLHGWWRIRYNGREGYVPATYLIKSDAFRMNKKQNLKQKISAKIMSVGRHSVGGQSLGGQLLGGQSLGGPEIVRSLHEVSDLLKEEPEEEEEDNYDEFEDEPIYTIHEVSKILREDKRGEQETDKIYEAIAKQRSVKRGGSVRPPPRPTAGPKPQQEQKSSGPRVLLRSISLSRVYVTVAAFSDSVGDGISFQAGETVKVLEKAEGGWWYIELNEQEGWAPSSYIQEDVNNTSTNTETREPVSSVIEEEEESSPEPVRSSKFPEAGFNPAGLESALKSRMNVPPPQPPKKSPSLETVSKPGPPPPPVKARPSSPLEIQDRNSNIVKKGPLLPAAPKKAFNTGPVEKPKPPAPTTKLGVISTDTRRGSEGLVSESRHLPSLPMKSGGNRGPQPPPAKKISITVSEPAKKANDDVTDSKPAVGIADALKAKFESNSRPGASSNTSSGASKPSVNENKFNNKPSNVSGNKPSNVSGIKPSNVSGNKPSNISDNKPSNVSGNKPSNVSDNKRLFEKAKPSAGASASKPAWMQKHQDRSSSPQAVSTVTSNDTKQRKSVTDLANVLQSKLGNVQKNTDEKSNTGQETNFNTQKSGIPSQPFVPPMKNSLSPLAARGKPSRPVTPPTTKKLLKTQDLNPHKYSSRPLPPQPGKLSSGSPERSSKPPSVLKPAWRGGARTTTPDSSDDERAKPAGVAGLASALKAKLEGNVKLPGKPENAGTQSINPPPGTGKPTALKPSAMKPGQTNIVQKVDMHNKKNTTDSNGGSEDQKYQAVVEFDGGNEGEMSLFIGQTVSVLNRTEGWWYVQDGSKEGWVPALYVEEIASPSLSTQNNKISSPSETGNHAVFRACADFKAQNEGEISLQDGQEVTVIEQPEGGWWCVKYGSFEGWVPSSYLEEL